ncbi:nickel pincer cofactor biosynthesis protein LarC [Sporolactobacillus sp. KGMB 08714]|uniref:nickel pincer cofactor biosynthesis protein LarC n=1 Tax=Sporolactobacillus sp. KGMB 08714 TaxID=3064704 RepID=UPI002FBDB292
MTKTLYIDCGYGIAGDMTLSALCGLGVDIEYVSTELRKVVNFDFDLKIVKNNQFDITANRLALKFGDKVHSAHGHHHNHYVEIKQMIQESGLNNHVKDMSLRVFETIAKAESKIHGVPIEDVAFHEVGAMDSIIDIVGNCIAIDKLGVDQIECTPVPTGHGKINVQHGLYPVPAPATLEVLKDVPLSNFSVEGELTTPTGAALVKTLTTNFVTDINGTVKAISYGSGTNKFDHPNVLRTMVLDVDKKKDQVYSLTCEIDDMTGEVLGNFLQETMADGALDIYYTPIIMKKNRPAFQITLLCKLADRAKFERRLLTETSTFGVRIAKMTRAILDRRFETLVLDEGELKVKCGYYQDKLVKVTPEYEAVKHLAEANRLSFLVMYNLSVSAIQNHYFNF